MMRFHRLFTILSLGILLLSGCMPVILPVLLPSPALPAPATTQRSDSETQPSVMTDLTIEPLFQMMIDLAQPRDVGSGELGIRYISNFTGGTLQGTKLQGKVLPDGELWYLVRRDQIAELLLQGTIKTADGATIAFRARAFSRAAPLTTEQLFYAELIDPSDAFFRGVPFFETNSARNDWLNHAVTIATYHYDLEQVTMTVYAVR